MGIWGRRSFARLSRMPYISLYLWLFVGVEKHSFQFFVFAQKKKKKNKNGKWKHMIVFYLGKYFKILTDDYTKFFIFIL